MKCFTAIILTLLLLSITLYGCNGVCKKHRYEASTIQQADCTHKGLKRYDCVYCDYYYQEIIDEFWHSVDKDNKCFRCEKVIATSLNYTLSLKENGYTVNDNFTLDTTSLILPSIHNGLPVVSIAELAFSKSMYQTAYIAPSILNIYNNAFKDSINLVKVEFYSDITIGEGAFYDCISLTTIHLRSSNVKILKNAFSGCKSLTSVHFYGNPSDFNNIYIEDGNNYFTDATVIYHDITD
ncbi:MAG: leucine-rich repeat protein [Clostridia bacterium]|nr:leucine-rich repeat protein [Clostridia bacterium]